MRLIHIVQPARSVGLKLELDGMGVLIVFALAMVLSTSPSFANECWLNKQGLKYAEDYEKEFLPGNSEVTNDKAL